MSSKANAKAPEKGSFPLDHFHECKTFMEKYMACMKRESHTHASCREETKACAPPPAPNAYPKSMRTIPRACMHVHAPAYELHLCVWDFVCVGVSGRDRVVIACDVIRRDVGICNAV